MNSLSRVCTVDWLVEPFGMDGVVDGEACPLEKEKKPDTGD
jgi:hypothetical protein